MSCKGNHVLNKVIIGSQMDEILIPTPHLSNQGTNHREPKWIQTFVPLVPRSVWTTIDPQCPSGYCVTLLKWALKVLPLNQVIWIFLHNTQLMKAKGRVEPSVGRVSVSRAFLIPGLVFFLNLNLNFFKTDLGRFSKKI